MPNVKQGGGYTLTFSKKNKDIKTHLDTLKNNGITITDYICEAVRFFEKNKNFDFEKNKNDNENIEIVIEKKIEQLLKEYSKAFNQPPKQKELLEKDLDHIKDEDMEED